MIDLLGTSAMRVLDHIDLHIPPGQFVAIVGKSGCGKSKLLRLIIVLADAADLAATLSAPARKPAFAAGSEVRIGFQKYGRRYC